MASAKLILISVASLISATTWGAAFAQQGTDAQREACTPDAFRLCMSAMPDSERVEGCLRAAGPRLSPACAAVFNPPSAMTTGSVRDRPLPREVQQRDRYGGPRYDQPRDYRRNDGFDGVQSRNTRDGFAAPSTYDDD